MEREGPAFAVRPVQGIRLTDSDVLVGHRTACGTRLHVLSIEKISHRSNFGA